MRSGSDTLEEVKRRTDLVEVVSGYVKLRKNGQRYLGLCPFHPEKTPSFSVHPEKQVWHCFGCGIGGDVLSFVERAEGLTFREALEKLADRCGVVLREESAQDRAKRETGRALMDDAVAFFQAALGRSAQAKQYLEKRGVSTSIASRFGLGFAPDSWDSLRTHLLRKGFSEQDLQGAGLVRERENGKGSYDVFRNRLIFPIWDDKGKVIAFGGRAFGDDPPKYLNSPETESFHKGRTVYALHLAREEIRSKGYVLLMEGYMDVLACHQHGFSNAVATLGTALTAEHLKTLRRVTQEAVLVYDGDSAGYNAALRSLPLLEAAGFGARVAVLPEGQDPDSLLKEAGPEGLTDCLDAALPLVDYQIEFLLRKYGLDSESGRREVWNGAVEVLALVRDQATYDHWRSRLSGLWAGRESHRVALVEADLMRAVNQRRTQAGSPRATAEDGPARASATPPKQPASKLTRMEAAVLRAAAEEREGAEKVLSRFPPERFGSAERQAFAGFLKETLERSASEDSPWDQSLWSQANERQKVILSRLLASPEPAHPLEECLIELESYWEWQEFRRLRQRLLAGETLSRDEVDAMDRLARQMRT
ncbi:MAG TPA: DNA primase [Armatimonadota bacterium]